MMAKDEKELWRFVNENIKTIDGIKSTMDVSSFIDIAKMTNYVSLETD